MTEHALTGENPFYYLYTKQQIANTLTQ